MFQFIRNAVTSVATKILVFAVRYNIMLLARFSILCGADVNIAPTEGMFKGCTVLWLATSYNNIKAIRLLIEKGADVNIAPTEGTFKDSTPLLWATIHNNIEAMQLLIDKGADVNIAPTQVENILITPLGRATSLGNIEAIRLLIEKDAMVNKDHQYSSHLLSLAMTHDRPEILKLFLMKGARVIINEPIMQQALLSARFFRMEKLVFLIENAHDVRPIVPMLERIIQKKRVKNYLPIDLLPIELIKEVKTMLTGHEVRRPKAALY